MKTQTFCASLTLGVLLAGLAYGEGPAEPAPCSVSVGITNRIGVFRTWTNALETQILAEKGLAICQDDAILDLNDSEMGDMTDEKAVALLKCKTDFKLELLFRSDNMTRNVTIFKGRQKRRKIVFDKVVFDQDYPANPYSIGSLKILRTIPTCAELQKLATPTGK